MSILIIGEKPSVGKAISPVVGANKSSKTHNFQICLIQVVPVKYSFK